MANAAHLVELIEARASDGVVLAGALAEPAARDEQARFDAVLMMHGAGGRFYDGFFRNFSAALLERGVTTLRANNRGHDIVNRGNIKGAMAGTALEDIADCVLDWTAWLDALTARGYQRVLVFGHSLGALKSAYVLALHPDPRVTGCVLASPPRFNTALMLASARGAEFGAALAAAQALVEARKPGDFIRTTFPLTSIAGAAAYLAKYAAGTRFDVFAHVPKIACPILALIGSRELDDPTFGDAPGEYAAAQQTKPDITFAIVPDGDHYYSRAQPFVVERLLTWIDATSA